MTTESKFYKKDKIEILIHSLLQNRLHDAIDTGLEVTLYKRRKEVVRYLDQNFEIETYDLMQRCRIYALLFGLFVGEEEVVTPFFLKLITLENDVETKNGLSRVLAHKPALQDSNLAQDYSQRLIGYEKLANQGHVAAQFVLGSAYEFGRGVTKDSIAALKWYKKAAAQGHSKAQAALRRLDK